MIGMAAPARSISTSLYIAPSEGASLDVLSAAPTPKPSIGAPAARISAIRHSSRSPPTKMVGVTKTGCVEDRRVRSCSAR